MPDFTPPTPPVTKYEIAAEEFLKAARGEAFEETEYFYRTTGYQLKSNQEIFKIGIEVQQEYIIISESRFNEVNTYLKERANSPIDEPRIIFYNCEISNFYFNNYHSGVWHFANCHVSGIIHLKNSYFEGCHFYNTYVDKIMFKDNSRIFKVSFDHHSDCRTINYENSEGYLVDISNNSNCDYFLGSTSRIDRITIEEKSKIRALGLESCNIRDTIEISGDSAADGILVRKSKLGGVEISNTSVASDLTIGANSSCGKISVKNSRFGKLQVHYSLLAAISLSEKSHCEGIKAGNSKLSSLEVLNSEVSGIELRDTHSSLHILDASVPLIRLDDSYLHELIWDSGCKGELYMNGGAINFLQLYKTSLSKDSVLSIINTSIFIAQFQELLVSGQLILRNVSVLTEPFKNEMSYYEIQVKKLLEKWETSRLPLLRLVDCSLGKTEITGSNLRAMNIEFNDSRLLDIFLSGTYIPHQRVKIYIRDESAPASEKEHVELEQKISFYDQFKKISEQKGDVNAASLFHSFGLYYQQKLLKWRLKNDLMLEHLEGSRDAIKLAQHFKYWGFRLNKYTNNHGISWVRALRATVIVSGLIYIAYFTSINYHKEFSLSGADTFIGNYFSFFNPAHSTDFMTPKENLNAFAKFFDFLGRIMIGYCIFQFIVAYRRHGKSSG